MPDLSRHFTRSALIYLLIGFTLGGLILSAKATPAVSPVVWLWFPAHIVLLLNGWLVQFAIGVAYWILPRVHVAERGRTVWAWGAFWTLQAGLAMTVASLLQIWWPAARQLLAPGVAFQLAGLILFAVHAWPRIRPAFVRAGASQSPS